jgi:perosamine synthetase
MHVPSADWTRDEALQAMRPASPASAVARLESSACRILGVEVVAFGSARAGLTAILELLGAAERRVHVPAFTCVAVPNAVVTAGGQIQWVDIVGPNLDVDMAIDGSREGDLAIIQHTYGVPVEQDAIQVLESRGVTVVEDRAHRFDGTGLAGSAAVFSLEHSKIVSGGRGGLVWARDPAILEQLRRLRDAWPPAPPGVVARTLRTSAVQRLLADADGPDLITSLARRAARRVPYLSEPAQTAVELAGGPVARSSLAAPFAAMAEASLGRLQANLDHRQAIAERYIERLGSWVPSWASQAIPYVRMPILVDDADDVTRRLRKGGMDLGPRWFEAPVHPAGSRSTYVAGLAPSADRLSRSVLSLPTHQLIGRGDADKICDAVLAALG